MYFTVSERNVIIDCIEISDEKRGLLKEYWNGIGKFNLKKILRNVLIVTIVIAFLFILEACSSLPEPLLNLAIVFTWILSPITTFMMISVGHYIYECPIDIEKEVLKSKGRFPDEIIKKVLKKRDFVGKILPFSPIILLTSLIANWRLITLLVYAVFLILGLVVLTVIIKNHEKKAKAGDVEGDQ
jgi:membrane-associated HD superfamily phosphohydrolase